MEVLDKLYNVAEENNIHLENHTLESARGLLVNFEDINMIIMDKSKLPNSKAKATVLAHELGHYETNGYYQYKSEFDLIEKIEYRADKAIWNKYIPHEKVKQAFENGIHSIWELSELFGFEEEFVARAVFYYKQNELI
jgi:hypothetical protein